MQIIYYIIFLILVLVSSIYLKPFIGQDILDQSMIVDNCIKVENDTFALQAPNIPIDPRNTFRIGGEYCGSIKDNNLAPIEGIYKFPIQPFLYDGVWNSDRFIKMRDERFFETNKCFVHILQE